MGAVMRAIKAASVIAVTAFSNVAFSNIAAQAADIPRPVYKAPVAVPMYNWSGLYVGGQAGWAFSDSTWDTNATNNAVFVTENHKENSWIAGGQLGLRWQFSNNWVIGVEGMWSGVDLNTNEVSPTLAATGSPNRFRGTDISSIYSVTGQLGYAWDRFMIYGKGGWAGGEVDRSTLNANNGVFSAISQNASGWTAGGGAEWAFGNGWSVAVEYAYYDLNAGSVEAVQSNGNQFTYGDIDSQIHTIVGRLNYTFNWSKAPVVAKY
jgi:outer membrane immunogenic protein